MQGFVGIASGNTESTVKQPSVIERQLEELAGAVGMLEVESEQLRQRLGPVSKAMNTPGGAGAEPAEVALCPLASQLRQIRRRLESEIASVRSMRELLEI